jgi:hypothetical protein
MRFIPACCAYAATAMPATAFGPLDPIFVGAENRGNWLNSADHGRLSLSEGAYRTSDILGAIP